MIALTELWKYHQMRFNLPHQQGNQALVGTKHAYTGDVFRDLSKYQSGLPIKNIHWPSFFKNTELLVKGFDQGQSGEIWFFIDASSSCFYLNEGQKSPSKFEYAKMLVLALCASSIGSHHRCRVFCEPLGLSKTITHFEAWVSLYQWLSSIKEPSPNPPWQAWFDLFQKIPNKVTVLALSDFFDYPMQPIHRPYLLYDLLTHPSDFEPKVYEWYDDCENRGMLHSALLRPILNLKQKADLLKALTQYDEMLTQTLTQQQITWMKHNISETLSKHHHEILTYLDRFNQS